jgi:hypothetical protein
MAKWTNSSSTKSLRLPIIEEVNQKEIRLVNRNRFDTIQRKC